MKPGKEAIISAGKISFNTLYGSAAIEALMQYVKRQQMVETFNTLYGSAAIEATLLDQPGVLYFNFQYPLRVGCH